MFFKLKTKLTYCFLHSCRLDIHAIEFSSEMQWYFSRVLVSFLATVLQRFAVGVCQSLPARPGRPSISRCSTACQLHVLLLRQLDLSAATATTFSIRVLLLHFTAVTSVAREQHALTPAASSHCRSLDVLTCLREFFAIIQARKPFYA
jgi:hypothetical protein